MLPTPIRDGLFDRLSDRTMRYVSEVPTDEATGLTADVYEMVAEDLFINGAVTSHSPVPELMAGMWTGGRETVLVGDHIDRATKEAMANVLATFNGCPYCEDMTLSLVTASGHRDLLDPTDGESSGGRMPAAKPLLQWTDAVVNGDWAVDFPRGPAAVPEAVGVVLTFSYIPRFSHVAMAGSPLEKPLGVPTLRGTALRLFSNEVRHTMADELEPGRALDLLPAPDSPPDVPWAAGNPRVQRAHRRWIATVDRHADRAVPTPVRERVESRVAAWDGEPMPIGRGWVDDEVQGLAPADRDIARFGLLVALSPSQVDDDVVTPVLEAGDEPKFVRTLAWAAMTGARRVATGLADATPDPVVDQPAATGGRHA